MQVEENETPLLSPAQKRSVDEAFQELFGYAWGTSFQLPRKRTKQDKNANLLIQVLGPIRAARILQTGASMGRPMKRRRPDVQASQKSTIPSSSVTPTISQPQQQQYETKLFAGKMIQVAVQPGATSKTAESTSSKAGIDSVLQQIAGPSKISTVAKTSADWDSFKTETGLEAELEKKAQGKDAFLVKQDFLTRVDNRKFELEKEDRNRERAKRGA